MNDNTHSSTATNSTKKQTSSNINNIKSENEDSNQYCMNLISTNSMPNNNIIIPLLTLKRPASYFNCKGEFLQNLENNGKKDELIENNDLLNIDTDRKERNKICKSQKLKQRINIHLKDKEIYNIFPNLQNIMPNFHKIKIEKGADKQLGNSLRKKIFFENSKLCDNKLRIKNFVQ